jgi:hypothetical protein
MLQLVGFPAVTLDFAVLQGRALREMQERDRAHYLAYLRTQSEFERLRKAIGMEIEGNGSERPTALSSIIAEKNEMR